MPLQVGDKVRVVQVKDDEMGFSAEEFVSIGDIVTVKGFMRDADYPVYTDAGISFRYDELELVT